ncbi:MAG: acetyltransferase [Pseudorhodobacter sp.]
MRETRNFDAIVVYGSRGFTQTILNATKERWQGRVRVLAMVDDLENGHLHPDLGIPVISAERRLAEFPEVPVFVTPGSSALRARLVARLAGEDACLATVVFPGLGHADPGTRYGAGSHCAHSTRIGANVRIGIGARVLGSGLGHDIVLGDFATVGWGTSVLGHVEIGEAAQIGTGAVVHQDVPEGARMMGNPAMPVRDWLRLRKLLRDGD